MNLTLALKLTLIFTSELRAEVFDFRVKVITEKVFAASGTASYMLLLAGGALRLTIAARDCCYEIVSSPAYFTAWRQAKQN